MLGHVIEICSDFLRALVLISTVTKDHIDVGILQIMASGMPLYSALELECEIFMFLWPLGALVSPKS